jgi:hypothetical protein
MRFPPSPFVTLSLTMTLLLLAPAVTGEVAARGAAVAASASQADTAGGAALMHVAGQTVLVMAGPASSLPDQLAYLQRTWPERHAVAVVTTAVDASCRGAGGRDCDVRVVPREYLLVRWLVAPPPGPAARFLLTFTLPEEGRPFPIRIGGDFLVFLAPTRDAGIFAATLLAPASDAVLGAARAALRAP